jgi:hypothetical protein
MNTAFAPFVSWLGHKGSRPPPRQRAAEIAVLNFDSSEDHFALAGIFNG